MRIEVPGGWFHVVNRGNRRDAIFINDDDRRAFLGRLAELPKRFRIEVHAFVLMDNHYHLLIRPLQSNLSRTIQWLQLTYAMRFNWAHQTCGHLFQGRFKAIHIQDSAKVPEVARYLHLNPVRISGLGLSKEDQRRARVAEVPDPGTELIARRLNTLDSYAWSSWRVYGGLQPAPKWMETGWVQRANGGRNRKEWTAAVRAYTEAPIRHGKLEDPWAGIIGGLVLGDLDYAQDLLAKARANPDEQTEARALARATRIPWERLVNLAEKQCGMRWEQAIERHGDWTRDAVLYLAVRHAGYGLSEVYHRIPTLRYQAAAQGVKRIQARILHDSDCATFVRRVVKEISKI
ncbi:MAG: transposase [Verrucomicrobiales bacterium]|nr:transposase [Verrucomicrobiales bacterium]